MRLLPNRDVGKQRGQMLVALKAVRETSAAGEFFETATGADALHYGWERFHLY